MWKFNDHHIAYPFTIKVAGGKEESCSVVLDFFRSNEEREEGRELMNAEITSGLSWPFDARFESQVMVMVMVMRDGDGNCDGDGGLSLPFGANFEIQETFSQYFLSHSAFLLRVTDYENRF